MDAEVAQDQCALTLCYVSAQFVYLHAQRPGSGYGIRGTHYLANSLVSAYSISPDDKRSCTDDEEQPIWFVRIFHFWKKSGIKAERQCDLCRLVEVRLQNMPA